MVYNQYPQYPLYPNYSGIYQQQYQPQQMQMQPQMQQGNQVQPTMQQMNQIPMQNQQTIQPIQGPVQEQQGPIDERIWVQGETAATAYLVAANGFVRLWDSTEPVFYEKQADATGKPLPMAIFDYKRRGAEPESVVAVKNDFVTRKEYEELKEKVQYLEARKCTCKNDKENAE